MAEPPKEQEIPVHPSFEASQGRTAGDDVTVPPAIPSLEGVCPRMTAQILSNAISSMNLRGDEPRAKTPLDYAVILDTQNKMIRSRTAAQAEKDIIQDERKRISGQQEGTSTAGMTAALSDMERGFDC
ncbi:hypothetical protein CORC01_06973 [Colletotrichum orchidophilum]|uniref:Uncharacterized protein n=1 Tax=Colletotrichum orchidophilum TaxID=1209926 RepID=A0A1G4B8H1_9PEZI|nr:uncharacterized protein CORC01_06973 [Colletotrichum orchidophilum]OHE97768.1 hypothetical protein CORC01_06973 [Colletotrichum orchidophilum]